MNDLKSLSIEKVKKQLQKLSPRINQIEIQLHSEDDKKFRSVIRVTIPKRRPFIAIKNGTSKAGALDKAQKAIIKQIKKGEKRWAKRKSLRRIDVQEVA